MQPGVNLLMMIGGGRAETVQSRAGAVWCLAGECCRLLRPQLTNVTAAAASALPSVCSTQSRPVCSQTHNNTPALLQ